MKLIDLVNFLFSKNAGPYLITFDVLFRDKEAYELARSSDVFEKKVIARVFSIPEERIYSIHTYDAALAIKFTIVRDISSGDFGDSSVFGSQQWAPLIDLEIEAASSATRPRNMTGPEFAKRAN
jgi:hypothetical protein